jgi:hypothetical protein
VRVPRSIKLIVWVVGTILLGIPSSMIATALFDVRVPTWFEPLKTAGKSMIDWMGEPIPVYRWHYWALLGFAIGVLLDAAWRWHSYRKQMRYNDEDIVAILDTWIGNCVAYKHLDVIYFARLDRELKIPKGSTKRLLERAAAKHKMYPESRGDATIKFGQH